MAETDRQMDQLEKEYEKPSIVWEDSFQSVTQAQAPSCAKQPLQSYVCDSRPVM